MSRYKPSRGTPLTTSDIDILVRVANGETNKEIASSMHISEHTVKSRLYRINEKLGAVNRAQAVAITMATRQLPAHAIRIPGATE